MSGLELYFRMIGYSFLSQMQYRASFIMMAVGNFVVTFIEFLGVWALFDRFGTIGGWTLPEVALFYGIVHVAFACSEAWSRGFDTFGRQVQSGEFDRFLLRPRSIALQMLGQDFQLMRVGRALQGLLVLFWAVRTLGIKWTLAKAVLLLGSIVGGCLLFSGLFVLQATMCFWTVETVQLANTVTNGGVQTAQYPLSVYSKGLRNFFIFIIPLASVAYFPVVAILGKADPLGSPLWLQWASPLAGLAFFLVAIRVFAGFGVRHYCSTGS
ncbi:MAG: ABC transporter permease [Bacillota bacterium]